MDALFSAVLNPQTYKTWLTTSIPTRGGIGCSLAIFCKAKRQKVSSVTDMPLSDENEWAIHKNACQKYHDSTWLVRCMTLIPVGESHSTDAHASIQNNLAHLQFHHNHENVRALGSSDISMLGGHVWWKIHTGMHGHMGWSVPAIYNYNTQVACIQGTNQL